MKRKAYGVPLPGAGGSGGGAAGAFAGAEVRENSGGT